MSYLSRFNHKTIILIYKFSMLMAWAIPGIDSPCCELVEFIKAPVAINKILFIFLSFNCLKKYPENTVPQHAQPQH